MKILSRSIFPRYDSFLGQALDYESLALHLVALDKQAKLSGIGIRRVIFDPELRQQLFKTSAAKYLQDNVEFMKNKAWVRHDEHYHVDFDIICKN